MTYIKQNGLVERFRGFEELASSSDPPRLLFARMRSQRMVATTCFATSDSPKGPFTNPIRLPATGIDPAIFIDRDKQAYYFWGQFNASGAKLTPSMGSIDESAVIHALLTEDNHHFHEGSSMRRFGNVYYFVFADSSRGKPTCLGYATSTSPLGPFTYRGVIINNVESDPYSWNNHGSIEQVNGSWYIFYHKPSRCSPLYRRGWLNHGSQNYIIRYWRAVRIG
ncbi:hypothetical protein CEP51_009021 [Fusarium floridanum]|uniref:Xylosidase/arabinosidase n=1 Tax=Fusarium floridanum TaxID=1325733 RepID=A0A428RIZ7_9HYPO|nr:hypothetical protein CEP51_009021 [Fusarium floridanum]